MAPLYLLLVICFVGGISGQTIIFVDVASGIQESTNFGTPTVVPQSVSSIERRSCVTGNTFYYVDGIDVKNLQAGNTVVFSAPTGETILSISCFCNLISIAFRQADGLWIWTFDIDRPYIILEAHSAAITQDVLIKYVPGGGRLAIVGLANVWQILLTDLLTIVPAFSIVPALTGLIDIGCSSNAAGGFDLYVVISTNSINSGSWNGAASSVTTSASVVPASATAFVAIAVQNNNLYYLTYSFIPPNVEWTIISHSITSSGVGTTGTVVLQGGSSGITFEGNVHGLHICGLECNAFDCSLVVCDCEADICGTCADTTTECQCSNSLLDQCTYSDNAVACEDCVPPIDACVFVRNPLALRRGGPAIDVVAVSTIDVDITLTRYVDTGRYSAPNLPQNDATEDVNGPLWYKKISFQVQNAGRGRRFGVYRAKFDIVGNNPTYIPAIVTENSGFNNMFYAYTAGAGDTIDIEAQFTMNLQRFIDTVRWRYTRVDQTMGTHVDSVEPMCQFVPTRLTCKLLNVMKETHEGVYEPYRIGRRLRNWHPLFFLFVRSCSLELSGNDCNTACPDCIHGLCDVECGGCTCYPGWMGDFCNQACSGADLVGASCTIRCSDVFSGNVNCIGLLISKPAEVPFACRSGLQPPECTEDCEEGYWGPNCLRECDTTPCDPRIGP